ncbi:MAG: acyl-protein synthetase, partial [Polyangiaceae bacterium]|nr:acyl-protein synthetase [Polyangiaceae bacterium]
MKRAELAQRIAALIDARADGSVDDEARDALLADLGVYQAATVEPYGQLCLGLRSPGSGLLPAMPTDVFRHARMAGHPAELDIRVFRTSGTTQTHRGAHPFRTLELYDRAAEAAARRMLFPDRARMRLVILAAEPSAAPDSSLSYMLGRFVEWFGDESTWVLRGDELALDELARTLDRAVKEEAPIALLGTSFAFVHALDGLGDKRWTLPRDSRIMQTGGFKGRSRTVEPREMRGLLEERFGVPDALIVAEYGMTEMSSQLYETTLRDALLGEGDGQRKLWVPGWVRALPVDPETLRVVPPGEVGILRIDDAANLDSVAALQTA